MWRLKVLCAALLCAAFVTSFGPSAGANHGADRVRVKHCRNVADVVPGGIYPEGAIRIHAVRVGCQKARRLPRRFIYKVRYGSLRAGHARRVFVYVGIWSCRGADYYPNRTVCVARGGKRVSWRLRASGP
jgi:hypothetical protein